MPDQPPTRRLLLQLLHDVLAYNKRMRAEGDDFDVVTLAAHLSNVGYRVHIRNALGGGQGTDCFHNLRHEFLVVQGEGEQGSVDYFVEVRCLAAQFCGHALSAVPAFAVLVFQCVMPVMPSALTGPQCCLLYFVL